ncbi:MAG: poly(R)-hydroxyalkanoic acid synthase subunit PhaE [Anaerolineae bacterium]|jgi:polyhydroxyalkanoate synthesis regulator phasin
MGEKEERAQADPFSQMVQFYDDWTKTWAGTASDMVSNKSFVDAMAQQLEGSLGAAQLMRRQMGEIMEQSLQQMSLPTRKDVLGLAGRLTNLEMRLDDMEAKLDEVLDLLKAGE